MTKKIPNNYLQDLLKQEELRQQNTLSLIASENYTSRAVRQAMSSCLTNKYAEGTPGKRFYAGCTVIDQIEKYTQDLCCKLFKAEYANVQPHSGSQANQAAMLAFLTPGDTIMGMGMNDGGHLTHGSQINFSGHFYKTIPYHVDRETGLLDYQEIFKLAQIHKPKMIIAGSSAYPRAIDFEKFSLIAHEVGAYLMADIAHIAGLVATGLHQSPINYADIITGTTHKTLRGARGGFILSRLEHAQKINKAVMPGVQGGPHMNLIAAKAITLQEALKPSFKKHQEQIVLNTQTLAQELINQGFILLTGGTDNHMLVLDLTANNITGAQAQNILESIGITSSKSLIPYDPLSSMITSGLRLGTPALTTRGMKKQEVIIIAHVISNILHDPTNTNILSTSRQTIYNLCQKFPIPK
jgi:glycine hydroxymethyltransferase